MARLSVQPTRHTLNTRRRLILRRRPARLAQEVARVLASSPDNPKRSRNKDAPCFDPLQSPCRARNSASGGLRKIALTSTIWLWGLTSGRFEADFGRKNTYVDAEARASSARKTGGAVLPLPRFFGAKKRLAWGASVLQFRAGKVSRAAAVFLGGLAVMAAFA